MLKMRNPHRLIWTAILGVCVAATAAAMAVPRPRLQVVSKTSAGALADGYSNLETATTISKSGRLVIFESRSDNLPAGDGVTRQVYVRDLKADKTRLVSRSSQGTPASSDAEDGVISANGRIVAFVSAGLPGSAGERQVWVHNLKTRKTKLASRDNAGEAAESYVNEPALSVTGRYLAFETSAENLPGGDGNARVYIRDLKRMKTLLASRTNSGEPATGSLYGQSISADGKRIAFYSADDGLPGSDGTTLQAYVRDLERGHTTLLGRAANGEVANLQTGNCSISANGRFATFESEATNLPGGGVGNNSVFVRDLKRNRLFLGTRNSGGDPQLGYAEFAQLSGGGRYLSFVADGANLPKGNGSTSQLYVRDLQTGKTRLVSRSNSGAPANLDVGDSSISLDGRWFAFETSATNLGGNTAVAQVFRAGPFR